MKHQSYWILDEHIIKHDNAVNLVESLKKANVEYNVTSYIPFCTSVALPYSTELPVTVYATINLARKLTSYVGCYLNEANLKYSEYTSHIDPEFLLNADGFYVTYQQFKTQYEDIFRRLDSDSIFYRPDSGAKLFAAGAFHRTNIDHELKNLDWQSGLTNGSMIYVSTAKKFKDETRFIIADKTIVDASRYNDGNGNLTIDKNFSQEYYQFVEEYLDAHEHFPDACFTVDVCITSKGPKIIEINSFSCAGIYACDTDLIVEHISRTTNRLWNEINE